MNIAPTNVWLTPNSRVFVGEGSKTSYTSFSASFRGSRGRFQSIDCVLFGQQLDLDHKTVYRLEGEITRRDKLGGYKNRLVVSDLKEVGPVALADAPKSESAKAVKPPKADS